MCVVNRHTIIQRPELHHASKERGQVQGTGSTSKHFVAMQKTDISHGTSSCTRSMSLRHHLQENTESCDETRPDSRQRVTNQCKTSRNSDQNHTTHHKQHNYANKLRHNTQENSILTCAYDTRVNILNCGAPTTQSGGDRCACQAIATGSINTIS